MNDDRNRSGLLTDPEEVLGALNADRDDSGIIAEVDAEIARGIPEAFEVNSADRASWLLRRINAARAYRQRVDEWADLERRRAEREEEQLLYRFGGQLRTWITCEIGRLRGRRKSISLPGGTAGYRTVGPLIIIEDERLAVAWAKDNCPAAVVVVERVRKTPLYEHIDATGELPRGIRLEPQQERFYVR